MKRKLDCQNGITKVRRLFERTTEKLESSKTINGNSKKSYRDSLIRRDETHKD